jgi:hypothetical protein
VPLKTNAPITGKAKNMMKLVKADNDAASTNSVPAESSDGYSRIGELARPYGVTLRTLRFYEAKGPLTPPREGTPRL